MNKLNRQLSLFSVLALVAFHPQSLWATSISSESDEEVQDSQKLQKSIPSESFNPIQDTLQKINNGQYFSNNFFKDFATTHLDELKQFQSKITPDDDLFDSWITLILEAFKKNSPFDGCLKIAKERGEHEQASRVAQYNLGLMYTWGKGVEEDFDEAFKYYGRSAEKGYALAQYLYGAGYYADLVVPQDLPKAFKYSEKAANQGHVDAQYHLASMYLRGEGTDQDLVQSLKWFLLHSKNATFSTKDTIEDLVTFMPSTITIQDVANLIKNQETLINNIEAFLRRHGMEKGINTSYDSKKGSDKLTSSFKESNFAIPSLFKNYSEIVDFEEFLLKSISTFVQSGFMVTCLQPNDVKAFKSSTCPDIKYYELKGQSFLIFGQDNIKAADKWMTIFDQSHAVYGAISDILGTLTEIHKSFETEIVMSDVARTLENQYILRLILNVENQNLDTTHTLTPHQQLVKKVGQDIEVLKQLQAIPQQLTDLLTEGAPVRNRLFLQNNEHIEPIFKD